MEKNIVIHAILALERNTEWMPEFEGRGVYIVAKSLLIQSKYLENPYDYLPEVDISKVFIQNSFGHI